MEENNILKFYINNLLYQITSYIFPIIYVFALPNILPVESFSLFAVFLSYISILSIVIDFGFDLFSPKILIDRKNKNESIEDLIFTVTLFKFALSIVIAISLFIFYYCNNPSNLFFISIMSISIIPKSLNFYWWFLGNMKISKYALYTAVTWIVIFGIMFIFAKVNAIKINLNIIGLCYFLANTVIMFCGLNSLRKYCKLNEVRKFKYDLELVKEAFPYFSSRVASAIYMSLGIPIFSFFGSKFDIAVYAIGDQIYRFCQSLISPFVLSFYLQHEADKGMKKIYKYLTVLISVILLGALIIYILKPMLQPMLSFNLIYWNVLNYFPLYVLALIANTLSSFFGFPLSNLYRNSKFANKSIIYSTITYLGLILILFVIKMITIRTLISAMILTELFLFGIRRQYFVRYKNNKQL